MASLNYTPTITKAGLSAAILANNQSVSFKITHISFGSTAFNPTGDETTLQGEQLKVAIQSSTKLSPSTFKLVAKVQPSRPFACKAVGFWSENTLFAIYSSSTVPATGIFNLHNNVETILSCTVGLAALSANSITVTLDQGADKAAQLISQHENATNPHTQYAPKASPAFTGTPTAPTAADSANNTQLATTAWVKRAIAAATPAISNVTGLSDALNGLSNSKANKAHTHTIADITDLRTKFTVTRSGVQSVTLDATKRSDWFREMQIPNSSGWGYYIQSFHNSGEQHLYNNFPLSNRAYFTAEVFHNAGYSHIRVTYPSLKRTFETAVNFNNEDLVLDWREVVLVKDGVHQGNFKVKGSLVSDYRLRVERNDVRYPPYSMCVDASVDISRDISADKVIGEYYCNVKDGENDRMKSVCRTGIFTDGNVFTELGQWNAENRYQVSWKSFSKTNNTAIGKTTDNERDRLQVNGTIQATAPVAAANNDQVPTTAWVKSLFEYQKIGNFEIRKYPDGTMIQTCLHRNGDISYNRNSNENSDVITLVYPLSFIDTPSVTITPQLSHPYFDDAKGGVATNDKSKRLGSPVWEANDGLWGLTVDNNRSQCQFNYMNQQVFLSEMTFHITAIGRWK